MIGLKIWLTLVIILLPVYIALYCATSIYDYFVQTWKVKALNIVKTILIVLAWVGSVVGSLLIIGLVWGVIP